MTTTNNTFTAPKLIKKREAAERYSVSLRQIDNLIRDGIMPTIKLGRRCIRIPVTQADAVLESLMTGGSLK